MRVSKHLNAMQIAAINKIGDCMIAGDSEAPAFSASGCVSAVDRILDYMPAQDLSDLKTLLLIFSFLPAFVVRWFLAFMERKKDSDGGIASTLRLIRLGLRGLVMTLYYSDSRVLSHVGYQVNVFTKDLG